MKKKIAFLLAAVMTVAAPMSAFADYDSKDGITTTVAKGTLFTQGVTNTSPVKSSGVKEQGIDYVAKEKTLQIQAGDDGYIEDGDLFTVEIDNAHMWFAEGSDNSFINLKETENRTFAKDSVSYNVNNFAFASGQPTEKTFRVDSSDKEFIGATTEKIWGKAKVQYTQTFEDTDGVENSSGNINSDFAVIAKKARAAKPTTGVIATEQQAIAKDERLVTDKLIGTNGTEYYVGYTIEAINNSSSGKTSFNVRVDIKLDGNAIKDFTDVTAKKAPSSVAGNADAYGAGLGEEAVLGYTGTIEVPLMLKSLSEKNIVARITPANDQMTKNDLKADNVTLTNGTKESGTTLSIGTVETVRQVAKLDRVNIQEESTGVIAAGMFELSLNSGFRFANNDLTLSYTNKWNDGTSTNGSTDGITFIGYNKELTVAYFESRVNSDGNISATREALVIGNMEVSRDNDYYNYTEETAYLTVRSLTSGYKITGYEAGTEKEFSVKTTGGANITEKTEKITDFANYGLMFGFTNATDKFVTAYSGKLGIVTPKLTIAERAADSWWTDRRTKFSVTDENGNIIDGVKIEKVVLTNDKNIKFVGNQREYGTDADVKFHDYSTFNRSYFETNNMQEQNDRAKASLDLQFTLSTAANYTGSVYITLSGTGINGETEVKDMSVKIAEIKAPISIETKSTDVVIGYQTYKTADIKITEDAKGVLKSGKTVSLIIEEFANAGSTTGTNDVSFNPIENSDIKVADVKGTSLVFNRLTIGGNNVTFAVSTPSQTVAESFTVSNVAAKINRSVPYGNYDLVVGGTAIAESYSATVNETSKYFPIKGVVSPNYIKVATPGDAKSLAKNVVLTPNESKVLVDGVETEMTAKAFINDEGRLMIPLRAVAELFDIPKEDILWDPATGRATIIVKSQNSQNIVVFTNNSSIMELNNSPITMSDDKGVVTKATITEEGRMFIPLRQLGQAYGIKVDWDGTKAYFNPTAEQVAAITPAATAEATATTTAATTATATATTTAN